MKNFKKTVFIIKMKLWLSRQGNGLYMLTKLKPVKSKIMGTDKEDLYIQPTEPVGVRNLCAVMLKVVGIENELELLESVKIELSGKEITQPPNQELG